ncbi:aminotransferase class I/II-fold pyridoxal phosphate-dependent enzyme [Isachenkonia alkalipeptolytica]|uniref:Aminotransferase class I/II-fold pyridoxal phosphate-dependent enzyme n=1 Tax=Isachenkonia alkalipeptolytica TaxID=2565777 RepID=A0AA43XLU7_9CLOT|nr:aminotransferase class I/II-fold pyridoxal phosphate-dependent enzyme [Isachenkonia alkalipeptolytica]NBG89087.1 aminotransferase class I/II-fold pyridoxal phosphate-dependent enzyme [Isachenkonia alkalipeptolytica]
MSTPLLKTLEALKKENRISFHTPGHKKGNAFEIFGDGGIQGNLYQYDTTEVFGTDQLQDPSGVLEKSRQWTADIFQGSQAYYLVNGSSAGVLAMILSQTRPGEEILLPRDVHQSVIHALILGDLTPRFIPPEIDPLYKIPKGTTLEKVQWGLEKHPNCKGVLLTHPNYYGRGSQLQEIRDLTKARGKILWVDQAHGAHLGLHSDLPQSGVEAGADLTVMSFHKTLPAMTQSAVLFAGGDLVDRDRLQEQLNIHQSSSPSYILMASIEQAAALYRQEGRERMKALLEGMDRLEKKFQNLKLFQLDRAPGKDRTKIWIHTENSGLSGEEVETWIRDKQGIDLELSLPQGVLALASIGNREKDLEKLYLAFEELEKTLYNKGKMENSVKHTPGKPPTESFYRETEKKLPIREAFYRTKERVSINKSLHRRAGSAVTPYPPGIPLILPGEIITRGHIDKLVELRDKKTKVNGLKEGKILVVTEE